MRSNKRLKLIFILAVAVLIPYCAYADISIGPEGSGGGDGTGTDDQTSTEVTRTPTTDIEAVTVEGALAEIYSEKQDKTTTLSNTGDFSGDTTNAAAGVAINYGDLIYRDATDKKWYLAGANGQLAEAIATETVSIDADLAGLTKGKIVFAASTFTPKKIIYLSTTAGDYTETFPGTLDDKLQPVGWSETDRLLIVDINPAMSGEHN